MRNRLLGWLVAGGILFGTASIANAQVLYSVGNAYPSQWVTTGQPMASGYGYGTSYRYGTGYSYPYAGTLYSSYYSAPMEATTYSSGYSGYVAPITSYVAPTTRYAAPATRYAASATSYAAPATSYYGTSYYGLPYQNQIYYGSAPVTYVMRPGLFGRSWRSVPVWRW